jgi:hypothetical protein
MKDSQLLALDKLAEINLSNNDLENIDVLSNYRQLFRINASFNKILSVTLALEKLIEMDLSNNKL